MDQLLRNRRESVVPTTVPQGENEAGDPWEISNLSQFSAWADTNPQAVFNILLELRTSYNNAYTFVKNWKKMKAAKDKAQEELFTSQTQTSDAQDLYNQRSQEFLDERAKTRRLQGELNTIQNQQPIPTDLPHRSREGTPLSEASASASGKSTKFPDPPVFTDGVNPT